MIDEIVKSTREASAVLDRIKSMPCEGLEKEVILPLLRNAVNLKLMIQEDTQREIKKYDCHQTSLAVQKKVLLLMFIERELGIAMEDDEASDIENLDELADAVIRHLKGGK